MTTIVKQGVHRFLQHALLIVDDDVRSLQLKQVLQTVVPVDHTTVEVVEVGSRETATFERNKRTQVWWNNRQHFEHHPLRTSARLHEALNRLQTLGDLLLDLLGACRVHLLIELLNGRFEIHPCQSIADCFCTHASNKSIFAIFVLRLEILLLSEEVALFERSLAWIDNDVVLVVDDALKVTRSHVEQQAQTAGHALEEPDV